MLVKDGQRFFRRFVLVFFHRFALDFQLDQTALQLIHLFRLGINLHADARGGFVNQVNRLVRQLAIRDVTLREFGNGVFFRRLINHDFLEAALQRSIFLDELAILIQRGGTHAMQLAARQRGLEHIAGIHCAFGFAGAHHRVQFVDEQNDLPFLLA